MICHGEPLPALPHVRRRVEPRRRNYSVLAVRKPRMALGMEGCNECRRGRVIESNEVVFQFNDLQLRRGGCSQREFQKRFY